MMKHKGKTVLLSALSCLGLGMNNAQAMPVFGCDDTDITFSFISRTLDFANILACNSAGDVSIDAATGGVTTTGCLSTGGVQLRAQVKVSGNQGGGPPGTVFVTINPTATIKFGTVTMSLTGLSMSPGGASHTFNAKNSQTCLIGGTLNVKALQAQGTYTGNFVMNASCL